MVASSVSAMHVNRLEEGVEQIEADEKEDDEEDLVIAPEEVIVHRDPQ